MSLKLKVLASLKKDGYTGDSSPANIKAFLKAAGEPEEVIIVNGEEHKVDELFAVTTKARSFDIAADDPAPAPSAKARAVADATRGTAELDIKVNGTHRERAKKSYDHKAKNGNNPRSGGTVFADSDTAEVFGAAMRMHIADFNGVKHYPAAAEDREIMTKTMGTFPETTGGVTIPQELSNEVIRLVESYGTARTAFGVTPMANFTKDFSRRTSGITGAWVGESTTVTEDSPELDQISLVAKKRMTITKVTSEILNDSAISIADLIATEIAQDFANAEDSAAWVGDGTSTYGGFVGLNYAFRKLVEDNGGTWGDTDAVKAAGVVLAAGNTFAEITLANLLTMQGRIPEYAWKRGTPTWYMNSRLYWEVVERLGISGDTNANILNGSPSYKFRGSPVQFVQVMPAVDANSQVAMVFGVVPLAAKFGEVRGGMQISRSEHAYWTTDELGFRGTERVAIKVHDIGNYNATAASRTAGPVAALLMSAS